MQDGLNVMFKLNGQFVGNMVVKEDMMFCELTYNFCQKHNLEKPTFYYQSNPIKIDSCRTLREIEIKNMSLIEVETNSFNNNMHQRTDLNMEISNENIKKNEVDENKENINEYKEKIKELEIKLKEEKKKNELLEKQINNLEKQLREEKSKNDELKITKENSNNLNEYNKIILEKEKKITILEEKLSRFPFELNENEKLMSVIFTSPDQKFLYSTICKSTDRFNSLENTLYDTYPDLAETEHYFIVNGNRIVKTKTLENNKIHNNDVIIMNQFE